MSVFATRQDLEQLKRYRDAGVDRAILMIATTGRNEALKTLDAAAALARGLAQSTIGRS